MSGALGSSNIEKVLSELRIEPAASEVKGERSDHCATEAPYISYEDTKVQSLQGSLIEIPSLNISIHDLTTKNWIEINWNSITSFV